MLFFESLGRFGLTMKKIYLLFPLLLFVFITCEDEKVENTKEKEPTIIFARTLYSIYKSNHHPTNKKPRVTGA